MKKLKQFFAENKEDCILAIGHSLCLVGAAMMLIGTAYADNIVNSGIVGSGAGLNLGGGLALLFEYGIKAILENQLTKKRARQAQQSNNLS